VGSGVLVGAAIVAVLVASFIGIEVVDLRMGKGVTIVVQATLIATRIVSKKRYFAILLPARIYVLNILNLL
jgi:hypothetical protein